MLDVWPGIFAYGILWSRKISSQASGARRGLPAWSRRPAQRRLIQRATRISIIASPRGSPKRGSSPIRRKTRTSARIGSASSNGRDIRYSSRCSPSFSDNSSAHCSGLQNSHLPIRQHRLLRVIVWREDSGAGPAPARRVALSICSGDFNEWVRKNTSIDSSYSYLLTASMTCLSSILPMSSITRIWRTSWPLDHSWWNAVARWGRSGRMGGE